MDLSKLYDSELKEFLTYNGIENSTLDHAQLAYAANYILQTNTAAKITLPILALDRATRFDKLPKTTAYRFLQRDINQPLDVYAIRLQLDKKVPYLRQLIYRIIELQDQIEAQTPEDLYKEQFIDYLHKLIKDNNVTEMRRLLQQGLSVDIINTAGRNLLWYASFPDKPFRVEMCRLLLEYKFNPNSGLETDYKYTYNTVLSHIADANETEIDRMYLLKDAIEKYGAIPDPRLLTITLKNHNYITTDYLLQIGLRPDYNYQSNLYFEARSTDQDKTKQLFLLLLKYGIDPNIKKNNIYEALKNDHNYFISENLPDEANKVVELWNILLPYYRT